MKLQKQPNNWSCILCSLAMVLNIDYSYLIDIIGHDGSEIFFPYRIEPYNRRGFILEEFISYLYAKHYIVMPFPRTADYAGKQIELIHSPPLHLRGILIYGSHAVAWSGEKIYDPKGEIYDLITQWDIFWAIERAGFFPF